MSHLGQLRVLQMETFPGRLFRSRPFRKHCLRQALLAGWIKGLLLQSSFFSASHCHASPSAEYMPSNDLSKPSAFCSPPGQWGCLSSESRRSPKGFTSLRPPIMATTVIRCTITGDALYSWNCCRSLVMKRLSLKSHFIVRILRF